jgi:hypothetical protein
MADGLPLIILAGSDRQPGPVPAGISPQQVLRGYKGAHRLPSSRPLVAELVDRYRQSGRFSDPIILGPEQVYRGLIDCELVHVEGNLAATLACLRELVRSRFHPENPVALSTCDILPTADEIRQLLAESYDPHAASCFWGQVIEARPEELGASSWKPSYHLKREVDDVAGSLRGASTCQTPAPLPLTPALSPEGRGSELDVYPGHLVIARPAALRIRLTNHLLKVAYRFRNRDMRWRHLQIVAHGLGRLMWEDFRQLFTGRLPLLTFSIPYHGLRAYYLWRRGELTLRGFENAIRRTFLHRRYQQHNEGRPVVFARSRILSLAKDIDTVAELAELGAKVPCNSAS